MLAAPRLGCLNLHASLLPRWRGAAPIQRAIMAGDAETGVDLMRMEEGLDTGPVAREIRTPIRPDDTAGELADRLAELGARLIAESLPELAAGRLDFRPQSRRGRDLRAQDRQARGGDRLEPPTRSRCAITSTASRPRPAPIGEIAIGGRVGAGQDPARRSRRALRPARRVARSGDDRRLRRQARSASSPLSAPAGPR